MAGIYLAGILSTWIWNRRKYPLQTVFVLVIVHRSLLLSAAVRTSAGNFPVCSPGALQRRADRGKFIGIGTGITQFVIDCFEILDGLLFVCEDLDDIQSGMITYDGIDIKLIKKDDLRPHRCRFPKVCP